MQCLLILQAGVLLGGLCGLRKFLGRFHEVEDVTSSTVKFLKHESVDLLTVDVGIAAAPAAPHHPTALPTQHMLLKCLMSPKCL